jgi:hypothetical protein
MIITNFLRIIFVIIQKNLEKKKINNVVSYNFRNFSSFLANELGSNF